MIQETAQMIEPSALEATLNNIRTIIDFAWEVVQHPFISFLLGILGYGVVRDRKSISKSAKNLVTKKGNTNEE